MISDNVKGRVGLALMALGIFLFALVILEGLTSAFGVSDSCANTSCIAIYDYSPLFLPTFYGAVLFSVGTIMISVNRLRDGPSKSTDDGREPRSGRTIVLMLSYAAVPICVFLALLTMANLDAVKLTSWSGFPATYIGGCLASLIVSPGPLSPCNTLIWDGFWIDTVFYTAWIYGIINLATLIPRLRPPHMAFPELEDITETQRTTRIFRASRSADQTP